MAQPVTRSGLNVNYSTRVDKVGLRPQIATVARAIIATIITIIILIPVVWIGMTAFKPLSDAVTVPPKVFFTPSLEGFVNLMTKRRQATQAEQAELQAR